MAATGWRIENGGGGVAPSTPASVVVPDKSWTQWSATDVGAWISESLRLPQYRDVFEQNEVDGPTLLELTEDVLERELAIRSAIHRKKVIAHIKLLRGRDESQAREIMQNESAVRKSDSIALQKAMDEMRDSLEQGAQSFVVNGDTASEGGGSSSSGPAVGCSTGGCLDQQRGGKREEDTVKASAGYPSVQAAKKPNVREERHYLMQKSAAEARGLPTGTSYAPAAASDYPSTRAGGRRPTSPTRSSAVPPVGTVSRNGRPCSPGRGANLGRTSPRRSLGLSSPPGSPRASPRSSPVRQRLFTGETPVGVYHETSFGLDGRLTSRKGSFGRAGMIEAKGMRATVLPGWSQSGPPAPPPAPSPGPHVHRSSILASDMPLAPRAVIGTSRRDFSFPGVPPAALAAPLNMHIHSPGSPVKAWAAPGGSMPLAERWTYQNSQVPSWLR